MHRAVSPAPILDKAIRTILLAAAILVAGAASAAEQLATATHTIAYRNPPGQLIDLGTHRLHLFCMGTGEPTVIMDFGLGGHSLEWIYVQSELARHQRACVYDRAGYGWSDSGPGPRRSSTIARELNHLIERARLAPPFVLVGHSFGGFNIRQLQRLRGRDVLGMVLIDSSHEAQFEQIRSRLGRSITPAGRSFVFKYRPVGRNLPPDVEPIVRRAQLKRKTYAAVRNELASMLASATEMQGLDTVGDTPLVVLTREPSMATGSSAPLEREWQDLQVRLMDLSSRSQQIIAHRSGHDIHIDEPQLVVDAVRSISDAGEAGTGR